jgi:hypothetical protein
MQPEAKQSPAMKTRPDEFRSLIAALRSKRPDEWPIVESRYFRWLSGDLPDVLEFVRKNRALAAALHEDAIRAELEATRATEPDGE